MKEFDPNSRTLELLQELVAWTRFGARSGLEETLKSALKDSRHQSVYELTDGTRSQREIAGQVGIDQSTISDLWARWRRLGLLIETTKRPRHILSLSDLGWNVPSAAAKRKKDAPTDSDENGGEQLPLEKPEALK